MATRSQVLFYEEGYDKPIVFYQHWDGYELPNIIADALETAKNGGRLTDVPYLGRIVFSEMLRHSSDESTGYGISLSENGGIEYAVTIWAYNERHPDLELETYDGVFDYTLDEFLNKYLKPEGAFSWKLDAKKDS